MTEQKQVQRLIVRITGKDLRGDLPINKALTRIKGISWRFGTAVAKAFEEKTGKDFDSLIGNINEEEQKLLEDIILNPLKFGIPVWMLNRQKDRETGNSKQIIMSELDLSLRKDKQRLAKIKSYRGLRLAKGLTVRGQKTKSTGRKGMTVGVIKQKLAPGAKGPSTEKKEEKKK